jgi:uncharacterized membrane protein YqaE (UPF0057 family)
MKKNKSLLCFCLSLFLSTVTFGAGPSMNRTLSSEIKDPGHMTKTSDNLSGSVPKTIQNLHEDPEKDKKSIKSDRKNSKLAKQEIREKLKEAKKNGSSVDPVILIILAILLPPLAVYLVDDISTPFWIDIILTLLFFLPGIIYALYRVLTSQGKI